ncbi:MAG: 4-(cytidine 5'-diphospho)-2-C-methyl-D-erythritol kinase, partial [Bacteroidota bacterium]
MLKFLPISMPQTIIRPAFAKVNLGLEILRKRPDGYHDLETIFYRIGLKDEIEVQETPAALSMECDSPTLPIGPENLCIRAAEALRKETGERRGAHIVLRKRIPTGSGLGGGSSDAAAVLVAVNELWKCGSSLDTLRRIAATVGSDVPSFLSGPLTFGSGRGEILEDLPPRFPYWLVCVTPPLSVSTSWAYGHLRIPIRTDRRSLRDRFLHALPQIEALAEVLSNDFEPIVFPAHPKVGETQHTLREAGCRIAHMSGSGSSVFGLTGDRSSA